MSLDSEEPDLAISSSNHLKSGYLPELMALQEEYKLKALADDSQRAWYEMRIEEIGTILAKFDTTGVVPKEINYKGPKLRIGQQQGGTTVFKSDR